MRISLKTIRAKIAIDKLKMKSKGEEMSTCNIKLNVVLRF